MKKSTLLLKNTPLKPSQIHKFRGFIGNLFKDYELFHNHDPATGKLIYRYPLIQFKLLKGVPAIIGITDKAVELFSMVFMELNEVIIDGLKIPVFEKDLHIENVDFGYTGETIMYEFISPWIALNQKNFCRYTETRSQAEKTGILRQILIGNILSMSKYLGCRLEKEQKVHIEVRTGEKPVNLKGKTMKGFTGIFKTNFMIPDDLGIGKSVSRGFGTVRRVI